MDEKLGRISFLDGLRGVAILMVILYHAYARWPQVVPYGNHYSTLACFKYGWLGVYLFFIISGFVILMTLEKTNNFFHFIYKRWLRLFPAMLIVSLLIFLTARSLFPERPDGVPVVRDLLPGLTFINQDVWAKILHSPQGLLEGVFWSLFVEVKFYLIFGTIFFALGVEAAILALIVLVGAGGALHAHFLKFFSPEFMGWFAVGAMFYLYSKTGLKRWVALGVLMAIADAALLPQTLDAKIAAVLITLFFIAVVISERLQMIVGSKILLFLGFVSYPLYLVHENMMIALIVKFGHWMPFVPGFLLPIIPIAIIVAISWPLAAYVEPAFRHTLQRLFKPNPSLKIS